MLGPSGCGKTTTLRVIAGLEQATSGEITVDGRDFMTVPPQRRNIGMVFQSYALFPHLTIFENVAYGLRLRGLPADEIGRRVGATLALLQLEPYAARHPAALSGGQQQRVSIARALVYEPTMLLLDEPLANLDAKLRVMMREEIRALQRRLGITTLYVTHDQEEATAVSDRLAVFDRGRLIQLGTPEEIYTRPQTLFVADFIGRANFLPVRLAIAAVAGGRRRRLRNGAALRPDARGAARGRRGGDAARRRRRHRDDPSGAPGAGRGGRRHRVPRAAHPAPRRIDPLHGAIRRVAGGHPASRSRGRCPESPKAAARILRIPAGRRRALSPLTDGRRASASVTAVPRTAHRDWAAWALGIVGRRRSTVVFLVYPLAQRDAAGVREERRGRPAGRSLTLANFARFFTAASYQRALWNSVYSGLAATLLATAIALPMAYAVARIEMPYRGLISAMTVVPLISPPFIGAYAWIILLGQQRHDHAVGAAMDRLDAADDLRPAGRHPRAGALVLSLRLPDRAGRARRRRSAHRGSGAHGRRLPRAHPAHDHAAARVPGDRRRDADRVHQGDRRFRRAVDPGRRVPGAADADLLPDPRLLQPERRVRDRAVNVLLTLRRDGWRSRGSIAIATSRRSAAPRAPPRAMRRRGARAFGNVYCWLVIFVAILPQLVIALASFAARWPGTMLPESYTLDHYRSVWSQLTSPIANSLILAGVATAVCIVFGTVTAYASARGRLRARWALDLTIMLPFVLPGLVVGVAYLTAFNSGPLVLTGTAIILVLAYFTRRVAFVFRSVGDRDRADRSQARGRVDDLRRGLGRRRCAA